MVFNMGVGMGLSMGFGMGLTQEEFRVLQVKTKNREKTKNRVLTRKCQHEIDFLPKHEMIL